MATLEVLEMYSVFRKVCLGRELTRVTQFTIAAALTVFITEVWRNICWLSDGCRDVLNDELLSHTKLFGGELGFPSELTNSHRHKL